MGTASWPEAATMFREGPGGHAMPNVQIIRGYIPGSLGRHYDFPPPGASTLNAVWIAVILLPEQSAQTAINENCDHAVAVDVSKITALAKT